MSEASIGGSRYFLLFKDDKSSFRHIYFLKYKSETFDKFKEFEQLIFNKFGTQIKTVRADNALNSAIKTYVIILPFAELLSKNLHRILTSRTVALRER